jgi:tetratricopeptide (TPR) repeat protein
VAEQQPTIALYHAEYAHASGLAAYDGDVSFLQPGIDAYRRALELEPPHAVWWANLAVLYWQTGAFDQALEAMEQATRYASDDPDIWLNMGTFYEGRGLDERARAAYHRVLELKPYWAYSRFWELTTLRRETLIDQPVEPMPYQTAETLWQSGQHDAALAVLTATIDRDPTQPAPYTQIARLYLYAGDLDRAENYLKAAHVLAHVDVDLAWIYYVESEIARLRGDYLTWEMRLADARKLVLPDATGWALFYGRDVAQYQFLRLTVQGVLLPQLIVLWPDPVLLDLLQ